MAVFRGKIWKFGDKISTDLMMPGFAVLAQSLSQEEAVKWCMHSNRPGWTEKVKKDDIIVGVKTSAVVRVDQPQRFLKP